MNLNDKTVLITGASSGLGAELARQLGQKGCRIVLIARREHLLLKIIASLPQNKKPHLFYVCNVADFDAVQKCYLDLISQNVHPDILVLNAGISNGFSINDFSVKKIRDLFDINFWGALNFLEFFLPKMLESNSGQIVSIGSLAGLRGMPKAAPYSSSKAALERFIESLQIDLVNTNIVCTHILPGFVKSEITEKNKYFMPFLMETEDAVRIMVKGIEKNKTEIHFPKALSIPAKLGRFLPNKFYSRVMSNKR